MEVFPPHDARILDGSLHQGGVVLGLLHLLGVLEQGQQAVSNQLGRGLVATDLQQDGHGVEFFLAECVALLFGSHQSTCQVVSWVFSDIPG